MVTRTSSSESAPKPSVPAHYRKLIIAALLLAVAASVGGITTHLITQDSPARAVEVYLKALEAGNAQLALERSIAPTDTSLLTNQILAAAERPTKITVKGDRTGAQATYTLAGKQISRHFTTKQEGKRWKVVQATGTVILDNPTGITLAGSPVKSTLTLFPGRYQLGTPSLYVGLTQGTVELLEPGQKVQAKPGIGVSQAGIHDLHKAMRASLDACIATKQLAPRNCPWAFRNPDVATLVPSAIKIDVDLSKVDVAYAPADNHLQTAPVTLPVHMEGTVTLRNGVTYTYAQTTPVTALVTAEAKQPLNIVWKVVS